MFEQSDGKFIQFQNVWGYGDLTMTFFTTQEIDAVQEIK